MICAAVDLGTNAFRLLIVRKSKNNPKVLKRYRSIIGLGSFLDSKEILNPPSSYYRTLNKIFSLIKEFEVERVDIVGTSVFRKCRNKKSIQAEFKKIYGHNLNIISPKKEAYLSSQGALSKIHTKKRYSVVVDIGGGSTEIVLNKNRKFLHYASIDTGVITLMNKFNLTGNFRNEDLSQIENYVEKQFCKKKIINQIHLTQFDLIMNAGTPTTLASIKQRMQTYNQALINGYRVSKKYTLMTLDKMNNTSVRNRLKIIGMEKGREKVIIYGLIIVVAILNILRKRAFIVSDSGILEGLINKSN
ncbi:MAG: hypothetical protein VYB18_04700 [Thermodesulfobacteriota bacterium]|nr:hypothetical protein [Thermodesulfobacteriota bacterium]